FLYSAGHHSLLHSFPTRRSSDLRNPYLRHLVLASEITSLSERLTNHAAVTGLSGRAFSGRLAFARRSGTKLFSIRQLHQFVEIKCPTPLGSHFSKFDLIPAIHPVHAISFSPNPHRLACNHAMNDFFIFGARPASHAAASPINGPPNVVICLRPFCEIQK